MFNYYFIQLLKYLRLQSSKLFTSRAEPNRADLCSCLARLQTVPSGATHIKPSHKSSEHSPSSKYSERA
ncbi:hypothetical protein Hanom_Chr02g00156781 [Helianthus anomalus]